MNQFNPNNLNLNWLILTNNHGNRSHGMPKDFILLHRHDPKIHNIKQKKFGLRFGIKTVEHLLKDSKRVSILFTEDNMICSFNPNDNIPSYDIKRSANMNIIYNNDLVDKIYQFFNLDIKNSKYYLKAHLWKEHDGMQLYVLSPQYYDTRQPVLNDNIDING